MADAADEVSVADPAVGDKRLAILARVLASIAGAGSLTPEQVLMLLPEKTQRTVLADVLSVGAQAAKLSPEALNRSASNNSYNHPCSLVWSPHARVRLFVGGSRAADDASVLRANGIKTKMCVAGTYAPNLYTSQPFLLYSRFLLP